MSAANCKWAYRGQWSSSRVTRDWTAQPTLHFLAFPRAQQLMTWAPLPRAMVLFQSSLHRLVEWFVVMVYVDFESFITGWITLVQRNPLSPGGVFSLAPTGGARRRYPWELLDDGRAQHHRAHQRRHVQLCLQVLAGQRQRWRAYITNPQHPGCRMC